MAVRTRGACDTAVGWCQCRTGRDIWVTMGADARGTGAGSGGAGNTQGRTMTDLDVQLSRHVAALVAERTGCRLSWTTTGTTAAAWIVLTLSSVALLLR
jgi:hypothetical protein